MENKLIFLHGSGFDKSAYNSLLIEVAKYFSADLITFNAPIVNSIKKHGYMWFNKFENTVERDAVEKDYLNSIEFIKNEIKKLNCDYNKIILFGHSQGGAMAIAVGLELKLKKVISICADMPYNLKYQNNSNTVLDWYEAKNDGYLNKKRQNSYKLLEKINANLNYKILENSSHSEFEDDIKKLMKDKKL